MSMKYESEVQFKILQGSARPEMWSELYEEQKARSVFSLILMTASSKFN